MAGTPSPDNRLNETTADSGAGEAMRRAWRSRRSPITSTWTGCGRRTGARARTAHVGVDGQTADGVRGEPGGQPPVAARPRSSPGTYRAPPVRRVHIPKGDGQETRPIGIPTFEDKVLQRAVAMVLEAVYEQDFLDCSYGFRPGRSAHQALEALWETTDGDGGRVGARGRHPELLRHAGPRAPAGASSTRGCVTGCCAARSASG